MALAVAVQNCIVTLVAIGLDVGGVELNIGNIGDI